METKLSKQIAGSRKDKRTQNSSIFMLEKKFDAINRDLLLAKLTQFWVG